MSTVIHASTLKSSPLNEYCLGVVLAGGLSTRMGRNKAKLLRDDNSMLSMLEFSKQVLNESGINNIVVSGDKYDVPDTVKLSGPVGGILSVLAKYPQAKSLLILPVDLPFMKAKALADLRLKGELSQKATFFEGHNIPLYLPNNSYVTLFLAQAFVKTGKQSNDKSRFSIAGQEKGPSIKALLKNIPHQAIQCSDASVLFNTNTPEQWQQAKQKLNF
ncbi:NTP transferase domain-containing protein [Colwellia sp. MSW7]|jgi:molybdopterin-guanine dinucleotide biosynthesis protein A|uniref:NTP transferase domain-containing protein n=1 Tax=Colwellia maritima TaxID=2912588 RepID=A0ABS9X0I9_9GAMM|nr:NTP transferase domain-containing protein [Colwellia maritima]MCI2282986.1 NTP transferase domain-containing protein [Colwellia maritima]